MQLSTAELKRIFRKLEIEPKQSTHHVAGWLVVDGKRILPLHYSHGRKDMPGHVPHRFRKALYLEPEEFRVFKKCHMDKGEYLALLRQRGVLT